MLRDKPGCPAGQARSAPYERLPDLLDVWQVGRASVIIQMQTLLTTNLSAQVHFWAFAEVARPAGHPAGRVGVFVGTFLDDIFVTIWPSVSDLDDFLTFLYT